MLEQQFNNRFRQIILFAIIVAIAIVLISKLSVFIPGILGAFTLYILSRNYYFFLVQQKNWKKGLAALLLIFMSIILILLPIYLGILLIAPKLNQLIDQQDKIVQGIQVVAGKIKAQTGFVLLTSENAKTISEKLSLFVVSMLNSTLIIFSNLLLMFFLFYYFLMIGKEMEMTFKKLLPLQQKNIQLLISETKNMVKANALGIPLICIVQGIFSSAGYYFCNVDDWVLWAFLTAIFAFFPVLGTMVIWIPLVLYMYAVGNSYNATALGLYSLLITGNVDYVARLIFMKKIGDVHPLITLIGVIAGLNLFGFMGLIFGPLLISYFIVLIKIYFSEFSINAESNS